MAQWCKRAAPWAAPFAARFMAKLTAAEKVRAGLQHAVVCPNVTGSAKETLRIAQSKLPRAGSLAILHTVCMYVCMYVCIY